MFRLLSCCSAGGLPCASLATFQKKNQTFHYQRPVVYSTSITPFMQIFHVYVVVPTNCSSRIPFKVIAEVYIWKFSITATKALYYYNTVSNGTAWVVWSPSLFPYIVNEGRHCFLWRWKPFYFIKQSKRFWYLIHGLKVGLEQKSHNRKGMGIAIN